MSNLQKFINDDLDISKEMYEKAAAIYKEVSELLEEKLSDYFPHIFPQGSFRLRTVVKPLEGDEYDVDFVCRLDADEASMKPSELKNLIGDALKTKYAKRLKPDEVGKRCWTLEYDNFHVDILPALPERGLKIKEVYAKVENSSYKKEPIRIAEKGKETYLSSNPKGYALWFEQQQKKQLVQNPMLLDAKAQEELPDQDEKKIVLEEVVKVMKRHRDHMWDSREDKDDKPISIIITTLTAKNYDGEQDILTALKKITSKMPDYISTDNIFNPVNPRENFADKWKDEPQRKKAFNEWLTCIDKTVDLLVEAKENDSDQNEVNALFLEHFGATLEIDTKAAPLTPSPLPPSLAKFWCDNG